MLAMTVTKKIPLLDLKAQLAPIREEIHHAMQKVIECGAFINGPEVKQFQADLEEYLQAKHVIPCANGTDALQIAMMGLGLEEGSRA